MFYLDELYPRVFCVTFHDHYQLCHACMRFSESEESDNPRWREPFTRSDFVEWYAKRGDNDMVFTYPQDWGGFNLRSDVIRRVVKDGIPDLDKWDQVMLAVYALCETEYPGEDYSILGVSRGDNGLVDRGTFDHEVAHAIYNTNPEYRARADQLFDKLAPEPKDIILQILGGDGYAPGTWVDETQAYLSTGFLDPTDDPTDDDDETCHISNYRVWRIADEMFGLTEAAVPFVDALKDTLGKYKFKRRLLHPIGG